MCIVDDATCILSNSNAWIVMLQRGSLLCVIVM